MWLPGDFAKDAPIWWREQELETTTTSHQPFLTSVSYKI